MQHPITTEASLSSSKRASGLFQIRKQNVFEINKYLTYAIIFRYVLLQHLTATEKELCYRNTLDKILLSTGFRMDSGEPGFIFPTSDTCYRS